MAVAVSWYHFTLITYNVFSPYTAFTVSCLTQSHVCNASVWNNVLHVLQ